MRHVTYYHKDTGLLHQLSHMVSDDAAVALNVPPGHEAIDHPAGGMLERLAQRVDVEWLAREDSDLLTEWAAKRDAGKLAETVAARCAITGKPLPVKEPAPPVTVATHEHLTAYTPQAPTTAETLQVAQIAAWRRIAQLEAGQATHMRRLALNPADEAARAALQDIETQVTALQAV